MPSLVSRFRTCDFTVVSEIIVADRSRKDSAIVVLADSSALVFDIGVAGVVVGLVFMIFEAFGDEEPPADRGESADPEGAGA